MNWISLEKAPPPEGIPLLFNHRLGYARLGIFRSQQMARMGLTEDDNWKITSEYKYYYVESINGGMREEITYYSHYCTIPEPIVDEEFAQEYQVNVSKKIDTTACEEIILGKTNELD